MNIRFENYEELNDFDMIDTYYDEVKDYKYFISQLQEDRVESQKYIVNANKEIERLNNIINNLLDRQNEALRYIKNHLSLDSRYKHGNGDEELILVRKILNKHIKELKGEDKE